MKAFEWEFWVFHDGAPLHEAVKYEPERSIARSSASPWRLAPCQSSSHITKIQTTVRLWVRSVCIYIYTYIHLFVCSCIYTCLCLFSLFICSYVYIYIEFCVYVCTYTYIHTHTHTHTLRDLSLPPYLSLSRSVHMRVCMYMLLLGARALSFHAHIQAQFEPVQYTLVWDCTCCRAEQKPLLSCPDS